MKRLPPLLAAFVLTLAGLPGHPGQPGQPGAPADPVRSAWQSVALAHLRDGEYLPAWLDGTWQAPNRRHGLRTFFRDAAVEVVPRDPAGGQWRWRWTWDGAGRGGSPTSRDRTTSTAPTLQGSRIEYARGRAIEWYDNRPEGLEQGFRIDRRPTGTGPLRLVGRVETSLMTDTSTPGEVTYRDEAGQVVMVYRNLHAEDADGQPLGATIEVADGAITLVVDDRDARYPVLVDPTLGVPFWTGDIDQAGAEFGYTVAAAGDVNNDGYDDILVGAPEYDNGLVGEGAVFLFNGGPDGPAETPSWTVEGNQTDAALGRAICGGWDFNHDDYTDIVLGAAAYSSAGGLLLAGRVWIYAGSANGPLATPVFMRNGDAQSDGFGGSVSAGPVNSGLPPDLIVGARNWNNGQSGEGRAYLFLNGTSNPFWPDTTPDWTYEPNQVSAHFGECVAFAGDVNGDGYGDVLVGAPDLDNGHADEGRVYVFHGTTTNLSTNAARLLEPNLVTNAFGAAVSTAGDINGDGYSDILVGAPGYSNGQSGEGRTSLYLGSPTGIPATAAWTHESDKATAAEGDAVATAGDINADGYADVIIGAPNYDNSVIDGGRIYVFPGGPGGLAASTTLNTDGQQTGAFLGCSVAGAGDVNGDGFGDILVGAKLLDNGETDEGVAWLWSGYGDPPTTPAWGVPDAGAITHALDFGDVNGDGFSDLVIGTQAFTNGQSNEGKIEVYHGSRPGLPTSPNVVVEGAGTGVTLGTSVCVVGDMNGDGYSDVVAGAPGAMSGTGQVRLYRGGASGLSPSVNQTLVGNIAGSAFGTAVAGGDVNGDGLADLVVAAPAYSNPQASEGAVYFYFGATGGLFQFGGILPETNQANVGTGLSVAVSDLNGDGFQDLIVGEPYWAGGQAEEGRVRIFLGSPAGLRFLPTWVRESNTASLHWGSWVAGVGDVNADGWNDWAVCGNAGTSNALTDLFHGRPSLTSTFPDWEIQSSGAGNRVAPLGDMDGDGIDDFLLANYNVGSVGRGTITIYRGRTSGPQYFWTTVASVNSVNLGRAVPLHAGDVNADLFDDVAVTSYGLPDATIGTTEVTLWYGHGGLGLYQRPQLLTSPGNKPIAPNGLLPPGQTTSWRPRLRSPGGRGGGIAAAHSERQGATSGGFSMVTALLDAPVAVVGSFHDTFQGFGSASIGAAYRTSGFFRGLGPAWPRRKLSFFPSLSRGDLQYRASLPVSDVPDAAPPVPALVLGPMRPNPLVGTGTLSFVLPVTGPVHLAVYDVSGRQVSMLLEAETRPAGPAEFRWDGRGDGGARLAAGVYFARLTQGNRSATTRIVLVR